MSMSTVEPIGQDVDGEMKTGVAPIRPNELPPDTLERRLSDEVVRFLETEVAAYGDRVYFWFRHAYLDEGIGLAPYDVAVARFVKKHFAGLRTVEIGAGMAELTALLAAEGFNATAIEKTPEHLETAIHLRSWLGDRSYPSYDLLDGWFPDVGHELTKGAIVIGLSITHSMPPHRWEALLDAFIGAAGVIIDLNTFFLVRQDPASQSDLVRQIKARGFKDPVELYSWKSTEQYKFETGRVVYFEAATTT